MTSASLPGQSSATWQGPPTSPPGTPNVFPSAVTLSGQIDPSSGAISAATLSMPGLPQPEQEGENTTFTFSEVNPGTATGTYDATSGAVTLADTLTLTFVGTGAADITCVSTPIDVALSGTYDSTTQNVTLATTSSFTIPQFPADSGPSCDLAASSLNASPGGVAGSIGNAMSLALNGQFAPGLPTTTTLAATPPSPQLAGTSVTLTATVTDPSGAGTPTGSVSFVDNGASIGSGTLSSGTATLTTSTLPASVNPQQLTAAYSGNTTYSGSTSSPALPYTIEGVPSVSMNLPSSAIVGAGNNPFSVTVTNPASGQSYANVYLQLKLSGVTFATTGRPTLSYVDAAGNVCPLTYESTSGPTWYFPGPGPAPCGTQPGSMSLAAGSSLTVPLEIAFTSATESDGWGPLTVTTTLYTGSCTSPTACTATTPLSGTAAPSGFGVVSVQVTSATLSTPTVTLSSTDPSQTVVSGVGGVEYDYKVTPPSSPTGLPYPLGTVTSFLQGPGVANLNLGTEPITTKSGEGAYIVFSTAGLAPGTYSVVAQYNGQSGLYTTAQATFPLTVLPAAAGVPYACTTTGLDASVGTAWVVTNATLPSYAASGSDVPVSNFDVTFYGDGTDGIPNFATGGGTVPAGATFGLTPGGTATSGSSVPSSGMGTTGINTVGPWTGLSASVPVTGDPGATVPVALGTIHFSQASCVPADPTQPATLGTVTISGNTLTTSPAGSADVGTPVTLTDTVSPSAVVTGISGVTTVVGGQVTFYDGASELGTTPVSTGAAGQPPVGEALFTTNALALGDHQLTAVWSGGGAVPASTSAPVDLFIGNPTTTTLASSASSPSDAADPVTFTATVTPPTGSTVMPTSTVDFTEDGNPIPSCTGVTLDTVSPPTAACTLTLGPGESHVIVATYNGDDNYVSSSSAPLTQTTLPGVNVKVRSSANPVAAGRNVTLTANVTDPTDSGTPTGTVDFQVGGKTKGSCGAVTLNANGTATCATSFPTAGTYYKVTAVYSGDANYSGATSATYVQNTLAASKTALSSSKNPSVANKVVTFAAEVRPSSGSGPKPQGYAGFFVNGTLDPACMLVPLGGGGRARCTLTLAAGTHKVYAVYAGDGAYSGSTSNTINQKVTASTHRAKAHQKK